MRFHVAMVNDVALRITLQASVPLTAAQLHDMQSQASVTFDIGRRIVHDTDPDVDLHNLVFRVEAIHGQQFQADLSGPAINYPQSIAVAAFTLRQCFMMAFGVEEALQQLQAPKFTIETVLSPEDVETWLERITTRFMAIVEGEEELPDS